jgi:hypothetical protein
VLLVIFCPEKTEDKSNTRADGGGVGVGVGVDVGVGFMLLPHFEQTLL